MKCSTNDRMNCTFSVPVGKKTRYRTYKCACGERYASVEIPESWLDFEPMSKIELVQKLKARLKIIRRKRGLVIRSINRKETKKGPPT